MKYVIGALILIGLLFNSTIDQVMASKVKMDMDAYKLPYLDNLFLDQAKLNLFVDALSKEVYLSPANAYVDDLGVIQDEVPGVELDKLKFLSNFYEDFYGGRNGELDLPTVRIYPRVTGEVLAGIYEEKMNGFQTFYNEGNLERSINIQLSTKAIDNHVLFPGERFSFNNVVGERTVEKGYQRATVIVRGEFSEDVGGGVCQVSSTLFNAVHLRGLQIVERYSHSRSVPYVPPGKDAAVSWWGPDFVFVNKYHHPVLIKAKAGQGVLEINIYGPAQVEEESPQVS